MKSSQCEGKCGNATKLSRNGKVREDQDPNHWVPFCWDTCTVKCDDTRHTSKRVQAPRPIGFVYAPATSSNSSIASRPTVLGPALAFLEKLVDAVSRAISLHRRETSAMPIRMSIRFITCGKKTKISGAVRSRIKWFTRCDEGCNHMPWKKLKRNETVRRGGMVCQDEVRGLVFRGYVCWLS